MPRKVTRRKPKRKTQRRKKATVQQLVKKIVNDSNELKKKGFSKEEILYLVAFGVGGLALVTGLGLGGVALSRKMREEIDCTSYDTEKECPVGCEWYEDECINYATKKRLETNPQDHREFFYRTLGERLRKKQATIDEKKYKKDVQKRRRKPYRYDKMIKTGTPTFTLPTYEQSMLRMFPPPKKEEAEIKSLYPDGIRRRNVNHGDDPFDFMMQFGKKKKRKKVSKKPSASLMKMCRKYKVRLTVKRGKKRVYKSEKVLKKQCKTAMRRKK